MKEITSEYCNKGKSDNIIITEIEQVIPLDMNTNIICRACMEYKHSEQIKSIFQEGLAQMMMNLAKVNINHQDELPHVLCCTCVTKLRDAVYFKHLCEKSDTLFRNLGKTVKIEKLDNDDMDVTANNDNYFICKDEPHRNQCINDPGQIPVEFDLSGKINPNLLKKSLLRNLNSLEVEDNAVVRDEIETVVLVKDEQINGEDESSNLALKGTYHCEKCDKNYDTQHSYAAHMSHHYRGQNDEFRCGICNKVLATRKSLKRHELIHSKDNSEKCNLCEKSFSNFDKLLSHMQNHNEEKPFSCTMCRKRFYHKNNMTEHMKTHKNTKQLASQKRKISIPISLSQLKVEKQTSDSEEDSSVNISPDDEEDATFNEKPVEENPNLESKITFMCIKCNKPFNSQNSYAAHMSHHYRGQNNEFRCENCNKVLATRKSLKRHKLIHLQKKDNKCDICDRSFSRADKLVSHIKAHSGKKPHECTYCGKDFNMLSSLNDHLRTHTGEKPFLCSICGKGFSQNTNLKQHVMRHSDLKPFDCPTCQMKFVSKGDLDKHVRRHNGERPFVCDTCGMRFAVSSSLTKHKRIHTGEKPYACDLCPMRFTALDTLKNHRRTHTGEKPFGCSICTKAFAQKSDLKTHMKRHKVDKT